MSALVFCTEDGKAYKVARRQGGAVDHSRMLHDEAAWLRVAGTTPGVREHVARLIRWHPSIGVIERECPVPDRDNAWRWRGKTWDLYKAIEGLMLRRGWTAPEYKEDSFVITARGPVLVDAGFVHRVGGNLLQHTEAVLAGRRPRKPHEDDRGLAHAIRMEVIGGHMSKERAAPLLARLPGDYRSRR